MVANLRADNIDGFLAPDPVNQRAVYDGVGFIHILSKEYLGRPSLLRFAASQGVRHRLAQHLCGAAEVDHRRDRPSPRRTKTASRSRKRLRRRTISTSR
jgi:hypothetical protein